MKRKKVQKNGLLCFASLALFLLFLIGNLGAGAGSQGATDYLLTLYGGRRADHFSLMLIMIFQTPWMLFLYVYASYFRKDFEQNYVYVFPRMGSKRHWLWQKTVSLFLQMSVSWLLLLAVSYAVGRAAGFAFHGSGMQYLQLYLGNVVGLFVLSFSQNLLSLWFGSTRSFLVELIFYIVCLIFACENYQNTVFAGVFSLLSPVLQQVLWHADAVVSPQTRAAYYPAVPGLSFWGNLLVCVLWFAAMYVFLYVTIERKDVMDFLKEE